jgi:predicted Zn-dependent protease with MMP-like domain
VGARSPGARTLAEVPSTPSRVASKNRTSCEPFRENVQIEALSAQVLALSWFGSHPRGVDLARKMRAFTGHSPTAIGIYRRYMTSWRRECDWDPTFSEFVARISLRRMRPKSNSVLQFLLKYHRASFSRRAVVRFANGSLGMNDADASRKGLELLAPPQAASTVV